MSDSDWYGVGKERFGRDAIEIMEELVRQKEIFGSHEIEEHWTSRVFHALCMGTYRKMSGKISHRT